ncbi:MAG: YwmB family TATA-box binding protein [Acetivibrio sp.]
MLRTLLHRKKLKYYLVLLIILWSGVIVNAALHHLPFPQQTANTLVEEKPSILLEKRYPGKLTLQEKEKVAADFLKAMQGKTVKEIKTEELFTIYAYSPRLHSYIVSENKKINLNMVFFYEEEKKETGFIAATPIYNEDY